jgi:hypothetical protein
MTTHQEHTTEGTADDTDVNAAEAESIGDFFNPGAPIPNERAARGRIRLAAIASLIIPLSGGSMLASAVQTLLGDRAEQGAALPDILLAALLAYAVVVATTMGIAMLFTQRLTVVLLYASGAMIWVGARLTLTFEELSSANTVISGLLFLVFAFVIALLIVHAARGALYLYEKREAGQL